MNKRGRKKKFKKFLEIFPGSQATPCFKEFIYNITDSGHNVCRFNEWPDDYHDCYVCDRAVFGYVPQMCCSGRECGCYGLPMEPPLCESKECHEKVYGKPGEYDVVEVENNAKDVQW